MERIQPTAKSYLYVDNMAAESDMLDAMASADRAAIDTEADSLHHYYEKVCLIQMTVCGRNFIIDPLGGLDMGAFLKALSDKAIILHGADYDLRMLRSSYGFRPGGPVIDTMIASQLLGYEKIGLASLIKEFFGFTLSKAGQKSDWSRRPLTESQLRYAIDDTRFLDPLADRLLGELETLGRRTWFTESCQAVTAATETDRVVDPEQQWRIRGLRDLTPRQAAFVRRLWQWRDDQARQADLPAFRILGNEELSKLAVLAEANPTLNLQTAMRLPQHFHGRRLTSLKQALREAAALKANDWPEPKLRRKNRPLRMNSSFDSLREMILHRAGELGLSPSVLAPRQALEEIARQRPSGPAEIARVGGLLRWQAEMIAPCVHKALADNH